MQRKHRNEYLLFRIVLINIYSQLNWTFKKLNTFSVFRTTHTWRFLCWTASASAWMRSWFWYYMYSRKTKRQKKLLFCQKMFADNISFVSLLIIAMTRVCLIWLSWKNLLFWSVLIKFDPIYLAIRRYKVALQISVCF